MTVDAERQKTNELLVYKAQEQLSTNELLVHRTASQVTESIRSARALRY